MSNPENTTNTTIRFIESWRKNNNGRLESELTSLHNETSRKRDIYFFEITQQGLVDPKTKRPAKEFISRNTPLQKIESELFENLETWAVWGEEGIMLWLSPPCDEYPCPKAIFSRIVYDFGGEKRLVNSAILFGDKKTDCSDIIPSLPENIKDQIRSTLFFIDENDERLISQILENIGKYTAPDSQNITTGLNLAQAEIFAGMIEKGISPFIIVQEMQKSNFLGPHPISCPSFRSASDIMLSNSQVFAFINYEFKPGVCRVCKQNTHVGPCSICKECEKKFN